MNTVSFAEMACSPNTPWANGARKCQVMSVGPCLPGAQIQWNIHNFPGGVGATAQGEMIEDNVVEIGLWFHDEEFGKQEGVYRQDLTNYRIEQQDDLVIPPNGYQMTQGFHTFDHPVRIDSFQPHGHLRMNAASLEIFYPETGRHRAGQPNLQMECYLASQSYLRTRCSAAAASRCGSGAEAVV